MIKESEALCPLPTLPANPLVTIITSNYNHGKYLEDTVLSILMQDYDPIELMVVDGGSSDNTLEILHRHSSDPRLRWISERDTGHMAAINKGLRLARGDLIGVQHSTDAYQPGAIREAVEEFVQDPSLAFVGGSVQLINGEGQATGERWQTLSRKADLSMEEILGFVNYPWIQASFFRRDLMLVIGGFHESCHTNTFLRYMLEASRMGLCSRRVPNLWGNYRQHPDHGWIWPLAKGLHYVRHRQWTCKRVAQQYKNDLTHSQRRCLRRAGYHFELRRRVVEYRQTFRAIPALMGYLWFGGHLPSWKRDHLWS